MKLRWTAAGFGKRRLYLVYPGGGWGLIGILISNADGYEFRSFYKKRKSSLIAASTMDEAKLIAQTLIRLEG